MHDGLRFERGGVGGEELRGEVVGAFHDDVVVAHPGARVLGEETLVVENERGARVREETREAARGGVELRSPRRDVVVGEQDLPMEVGALDAIVVDDADRPYPGVCEPERHWRADAARTDDEHPPTRDRCRVHAQSVARTRSAAERRQV